jgi:hypothetical protein
MKQRVHKPGFRRALAVAVISAMAVLPASALGAEPISEQSHFVGTHAGLDFCGVTVDEVFKGTVTRTAFFDNDGNFVRFQETFSGQSVFTASNGKSVTLTFAQRFSTPPLIIDEQAGTLTFVFTITGLSEQLRAAQGGVLIHDVGLLTFAQTFDLATGKFISGEVVALNGPHDDLESGFTAFCEAFRQALA